MGTNHAKHEILALTPNLNITACTSKFLSTGFVTDRVKFEETEPFLKGRGKKIFFRKKS